MEKGPKIRVIGGVPEKEKQQARKRIREALFQHIDSLPPEYKELVEKHEYKKTEKELKIISFANNETCQLMEEAGIEPYNVPPENFHILPPEIYNQLISEIFGKSVASTLITEQGIFLDAQFSKRSPVLFADSVIHELLHLKSHLSLELQKKDNKILENIYRSGVLVSRSLKKIESGETVPYFIGLNEAIITQTEKQILKKLLEQPFLAKEKEDLELKRSERKRIAQEKNIPEDDILWISQDQRDCFVFPYFYQRQVLNFISNKIREKFPDQYKTPEHVHKAFLRAQFTGQLLPVARLIEKIFGKGSFKILGAMTHDPQSAIYALIYFKNVSK